MKQQALIKKLSSGNVQESDQILEIKEEIEKELSVNQDINFGAPKHDIPDNLDIVIKTPGVTLVPERTSSSLEHKRIIEPNLDIPTEEEVSAIDSVKKVQEVERSQTPEIVVNDIVISARGESRLLLIRSTAGIQMNPVKIHLRKAGSSQYLTFTFQIKLDGQSVGFVEKGRHEFQSLEQALQGIPNATEKSTLSLPDKLAFSSTANGRQTGSYLQSWLAEILQSFPDFPPLLEFLKSNGVPAPTIKVLLNLILGIF
jgi:hypothetical protein